MEKGLVAVIDVGSTAVRLVIAELDKDSNWKIIDRAGKPVPFGRDVFTSGSISRDTLNLTLKILRGFREILDGWKISEENITIIATSALREARNRDTFIDRVYIKTGFVINVVEGIEENRLTYMAVQYAVGDLLPQLGRSNSIIIEVGGGSTEVMLLKRGKMAGAHSLNIGTVRIEQFIQNAPGPEYRSRFLTERVATMTEALDTELELKRIRNFIAVGGHARLAAMKVGEEQSSLYSVISKEAFLSFLESIRRMSTEDLVRKLQISYNDADGLITGLNIYRYFLEETSAERLIVPGTSIREGVLISLTLGPDPQVRERFNAQVAASATALGRKFHIDEEHGLHVSELACSLFDQLEDEHGLSRHYRLLLEIAAVLHDIGSYIKFSGHHKHGQYIISNSEIFGLHKDDIQIISNVVRYHRKSFPVSSHTSYISLSREDRLGVLKLAALLRIADALDRGHTQRVKDIKAEKREETLILHCSCLGDISSETLSLRSKAQMFEQVFGYRVILG